MGVEGIESVGHGCERLHLSETTCEEKGVKRITLLLITSKQVESNLSWKEIQSLTSKRKVGVFLSYTPYL